MESQVLSTIQLMENNKVIHTIKIEKVESYVFIFDSENSTTLNIVSKNLNMDDLNVLVTKPYESYILTGVKRITQNGYSKTFDIPPRIFKRVLIKEDGKFVDMTFYENWRDSID